MPMKVLYTIKTRGWRPTALDEVEPPDPNRMVGWKGLAEHVDVSLKTAQRMVSAGTLPRCQTALNIAPSSACKVAPTLA